MPGALILAGARGGAEKEKGPHCGPFQQLRVTD
jgi:hypothetical protein